MKLRWCLLLTAFLACGAAAQELRVAVSTNSKPMSWRDNQGELVGFNVDIARTLCATIEAACRIEEHPLATTITRLSDNTIDFAVSSLVETEARKHFMLFTRPYYRGASFWIGKGSTEDAPDQRVGAIGGSIQAEFIRENAQARGWRPHPLPDGQSVLNALRNGEIDAAIVPMAAAFSVLTSQEMLAAGFGARPVNTTKLAPLARVAVSRQQGAALVEKLNAALDAMEKSGALNRLSAKYFPFKLQ